MELLDGACGFLGIVSGNYYCGAAAPAGMLASMNGLLTAVVFGAGQMIGRTCDIFLDFVSLIVLFNLFRQGTGIDYRKSFDILLWDSIFLFSFRYISWDYLHFIHDCLSFLFEENGAGKI